MGEKYKVAVASSDGKTVDSHFGHAQSFLIFEVDEESGSFEDVEERAVTAGCSGGDCGVIRGSLSCGNSPHEDASPLDAVAASLKDVDYVLVAKIGPHAIKALAQFDVTAYDIVLPIDEAINKINEFRKKINARKL
ncbi:MAG: hypothetical protein K6G00_00810 [Treponema sp.]|nr:hypothetical protein [Treponema sp.]